MDRKSTIRRCHESIENACRRWSVFSAVFVITLSLSPHAIAQVSQPYVTTSVSNPQGGAIIHLFANQSQLLGTGPLTYQGLVASAPLAFSLPVNLVIDRSVASSFSLMPTGNPNEFRLFIAGAPSTFLYQLNTFPGFKTGSLLHGGLVTDTSTGNSVQFTVDNDPVPVVVVAAGIAGAICLIGMIAEWFSESCADQAIRACGGAGNVKSVEVRITAWSIFSGCRRECHFTCK